MNLNRVADVRRLAKDRIAPLSRVHGMSDASGENVQVISPLRYSLSQSNFLLQSTPVHWASSVLPMAHPASPPESVILGPFIPTYIVVSIRTYPYDLALVLTRFYRSLLRYPGLYK